MPPPCPNCGLPVPDGATLCRNCGAEVRAAWPPPPEGQESPPRPTPPNPADAWNGLGLGCLLSAPLYGVLGLAVFMESETRYDPGWHPNPAFRYGTWTVNLVPLALVGLLYLTLRPRCPTFARGLGYCLVVILGLLLYGLATCRN